LQSSLSSKIANIENKIKDLNSNISNIQGEKNEEQLTEEEKAQIKELEEKIA
jgi:hypothetical protein